MPVKPIELKPEVTHQNVPVTPPTGPQPPAIIIVSGNADEQEARQLLQRGAVDYVMKPVDLNYLQQAIAAAADTALP